MKTERIYIIDNDLDYSDHSILFHKSSASKETVIKFIEACNMSVIGIANSIEWINSIKPDSIDKLVYEKFLQENYPKAIPLLQKIREEETDEPNLEELSKEFDAMVARMNTPEAKKAARMLFDLSIEELVKLMGEAAVKATKKQD